MCQCGVRGIFRRSGSAHPINSSSNTFPLYLKQKAGAKKADIKFHEEVGLTQNHRNILRSRPSECEINRSEIAYFGRKENGTGIQLSQVTCKAKRDVLSIPIQPQGQAKPGKESH